MVTVDGGTFTIPAEDRPTVVFFMAGWCATCIPEAEALGAIHRDLGEQVAILAVDADDTVVYRDAYPPSPVAR